MIYGANVTRAIEEIDYGSVLYRTQAVYMNRFDGDTIMGELWRKVEQGESLSDEDELNLIFLPLMHSKVNRAKRAVKTAEIARKIPDEQQRVRLTATIIGISDKFIDQDYVEKLMEVLKMARVLQMAEQRGEERGELKGEIKAMRSLIKRGVSKKLGSVSEGMQTKIDSLSDLTLLNELHDHVYDAETSEAVETSIDRAVEKQAVIANQAEEK